MEHQDLARLQLETHTVRVQAAWSSRGTIPPAVQMRLEREAKEFFQTRRIKPRVKPPKRKKPKVVPAVEKNDRLGCTVYASGFKTHSFESADALSTECVKIQCGPIAGGRISFRSAVNITHDLAGREMEPIRIKAPILRTYMQKQECSEAVSHYLKQQLFELYVRVVSHIRRTRFDPPYAGSDIDGLLSNNSSVPIADCELPDNVYEEYYNWGAYVKQLAEAICAASGTDYINPDSINSEMSSSDSE